MGYSVYLWLDVIDDKYYSQNGNKNPGAQAQLKDRRSSKDNNSPGENRHDSNKDSNEHSVAALGTDATVNLSKTTYFCQPPKPEFLINSVASVTLEHF